jgi:hypothetical protein
MRDTVSKANKVIDKMLKFCGGFEQSSIEYQNISTISEDSLSFSVVAAEHDWYRARVMYKHFGDMGGSVNICCHPKSQLVSFLNNSKFIIASKINDNTIFPIIQEIAKENNSKIVFNNIEHVTLFMIVFFCDYVHDLKSLDLLAKKLSLPSVGTTETKLAKLHRIFIGWINNVGWLVALKPEIVYAYNSSTELKGLVEQIFRNTNTSDETESQKLILGYLQNNVLRGPLPFVEIPTTSSIDLTGFNIDVSFDQTSKGSSYSFLSRVIQNVRFDLNISVFADWGLTQASNPFGTFITLNTNTEVEDEISVQLIDINGKLILNEQIVPKNHQLEIPSHCAPGTYLLNCYTLNGQFIQQTRLIKMNTDK